MQNRRKLVLSLIALYAANVLLILTMRTVPDAQATTFRQGAKGETVKQIQMKLQNWGYYNGAIDGEYGPRTAEAIKQFQRKNNLTIDGAAGTRTLQALGIYIPAANANTEQRQNDEELLARVISAEAKGESYNAQVAVGAVVLNRVRHPSFPNTICGVIYQPGAFDCVTGDAFNKPASDSAKRAARDALNGVDPVFGAVFFYDHKTTDKTWLRLRQFVLDIGNLRFCK